MKQGSTLFLRTAVTVIGLGIGALCLLLLPAVWVHAYDDFPQYGGVVRIVVSAMYLAALFFYVGIYNGWRTLNLIDKGQAFSRQTVTLLRKISWCAGIISLIYLASLPFFYIWADNDDAPGLMLIGLFLIGMPLIISVAVGLLGRLLDEAVSFKAENDLTV